MVCHFPFSVPILELVRTGSCSRSSFRQFFRVGLSSFLMSMDLIELRKCIDEILWNDTKLYLFWYFKINKFKPKTLAKSRYIFKRNVHFLANASAFSIVFVLKQLVIWMTQEFFCRSSKISYQTSVIGESSQTT